MPPQRNEMLFTHTLNLRILATLTLGLFALLVYNISHQQDGLAVSAMAHQVFLLLITGIGIYAIYPMPDQPDMGSSDVTDAVRGVLTLALYSIPAMSVIVLVAGRYAPEVFTAIDDSIVQIMVQGMVTVALLAVGIIVPKKRRR